jgi:hypothetical protein
MTRNEAAIVRKYREHSTDVLRVLRDSADRDSDNARKKWMAARDCGDKDAMKAQANMMNTNYDIAAQIAFVLAIRNAA